MPQTALFRSGEQWPVFVVKDGRARLRMVVPGPSDGSRTVINDGLAEGDSIVVQPSDLVTDGTRVSSAIGS
jgi:HlyD family secretion protein